MRFLLYRLLKDGVEFVWSDECVAAFAAAKNTITANSVTTHYDVSKSLVREYDTSVQGIGAVLSHVYPDKSIRPIVYASRALCAAESHYSKIE